MPEQDEQILNQLDNENLISKKAEEIASAKISELQDNLKNALGGQTKKGYSNFDEMQADIDRRAEEKARTYAEQAKEEIRKELTQKEEQAKQARDAAAKQTIEEQKKEWAQMTNEWKEAVADGVAPPINPDLAQRLEKGAKWEDLTEEDRKDRGLVFYNQARQMHAELKKEGKASSFYRTISQLDQKPAGAKAPVFGGSVASSSSDDDFEYDDLHEQTRKIFGTA